MHEPHVGQTTPGCHLHLWVPARQGIDSFFFNLLDEDDQLEQDEEDGQEAVEGHEPVGALGVQVAQEVAVNLWATGSHQGHWLT